MTKETMTVHKALAELKLLDDRIAKSTKEGIYCVGKKHSEKTINGIPAEEVVETIKSQYSKVTDLIKRRKAIKRAVVLSNAVTEIEIGGKVYTVAEAIEMKNHGIDFERDLKFQMERRFSEQTLNAHARNGEALEKRADQYVTALFGQKETKNLSAEAEETRKKFLEANRYEIIDPLSIQALAEQLGEEIAAFTADVDSALSCSNALTNITIEY